ncbi:hypothetical protein D3C72_976380 [compost metagenome]
MDLLEHEVLEAGFFSGHQVPVDAGDGVVDGLAIAGEEVDALAADLGDLAVFHVDDLAGVVEDGGNVRGEEVLALADADDQGAALAGADEAAGLGLVQHGDGVGALDGFERVEHGVEQIAVVEARDQVREHLGVGLGLELDAAGHELGFQLNEVLDDAVVHHHQITRGVGVRVGVVGGGAAVGGPAGVADALRAHGRVGGELGFQVAQFADLAAQIERARVRDGDAGRVIAPVLQALEALHQDLGSGLLPDVTDDSTHKRSIPQSVAERPEMPLSLAFEPGLSNITRKARLNQETPTRRLCHNVHARPVGVSDGKTRPLGTGTAGRPAGRRCA